MRIAFLTADDPLYLPTLFDHVLHVHGGNSSVFVVPPLYKGQTAFSAARRYQKTFGNLATAQLAVRTLSARLERRSISRTCRRHGVPCEEVDDVNHPAFVDRLASEGVDVIVSVSCPQIFQPPLIAVPRLGCLNVHGAILPSYRGVMPSFWMLANGEERAGVSIFFVNDEIDAGELCGQKVFPIRAGESLDEFLRRSKMIAAELILDVLGLVENGRVRRKPLDLSKGSYYSWPGKTDVARLKAAGHSLW
jgi:methionyl-tRNA formyltransferase